MHSEKLAWAACDGLILVVKLTGSGIDSKAIFGHTYEGLTLIFLFEVGKTHYMFRG